VKRARSKPGQLIDLSCRSLCCSSYCFLLHAPQVACSCHYTTGGSMPKKSKGSNSKRVSLKDKHKVIKKVKDHNRKKRKEAKKLGKRKPSLLKDPGIPNNFPYREQVVKEFKFEQQRIQATEAAKKDARKERRRARQVSPSAAICASIAQHFSCNDAKSIRKIEIIHPCDISRPTGVSPRGRWVGQYVGGLHLEHVQLSTVKTLA
jgi:hypothetical protein